MTSTPATSLLSRLKASRRLPSPAGVAIRVLELCRSEDSESQEIAEVIMSDPALSGRLLKYANSAAVGIGRDVNSVRDAVLIMGLRAVKLTALGFSLSVPENKPDCPGFDFKRFWIESFLAAAIARRLAADHFIVDREEAFTAALLAGMGRLALAYGLPEKYNQVLRATARGESLVETEHKLLGVDHAQFGAAMLADWQLPRLLVQAVEHQHQPQDAPWESGPLQRAVHVAVRLVPLFVPAGQPAADAKEIATARDLVENTLKLDEEQWKHVADDILASFHEVADIFEISSGSELFVLGLYEKAQEEATSVGMVAHLEQIRTLAANEELLHRATTDALTGIANRAKFDEKLDEAIKGLRRGHGDFVVLLIDIDEFKQINDTYGHHAGDLVLKRVAAAIENVLREVDLAVRHGGDEFAVLAVRTGPKGAGRIAARVCKATEDLVIETSGRAARVTVSVGVAATADYEVPPTATELMAAADKQLYVAKKAGRNRWAYQGQTPPPLPTLTYRDQAGAA